MSSAHFRAGVVAVVERSDGWLLVFERSDHLGQWQFPQGGIEPGETPVDAVWRELHEETGLDNSQVTLVREHPVWTVYEYPDDHQDPERPQTTGRRPGRLGAAHRWFFFRVNDDTITPTPDGSEFVSWAWWPVDQILASVAEFRQPSYRSVLYG
jgi:putative (di)nucleoside polyphosphate hydrolase